MAVTGLELHSHQGQRHCTVSSAGDLTSMSSNPLGSQLGGILPCHEDILQFLETLLVVQLQEGRGGSVTSTWWEVARHASRNTQDSPTKQEIIRS